MGIKGEKQKETKGITIGEKQQHFCISRNKHKEQWQLKNMYSNSRVYKWSKYFPSYQRVHSSFSLKKQINLFLMSIFHN